MRFKLLLIFIVGILSYSTYAQSEKDSTNQSKESFKDRLYFDGNFNLGFGTQTFINFSPKIGYKITDKFSAGVGLKFWYNSLNNGYYKSSGTVYGGGFFARRSLTQNLYLTSEFEHLNIGGIYNSKEPLWVNFLFVGGGYQQSIGGVVNVNAALLYDVLYDPYLNPYSSYLYPSINIAGIPLIIRFGISIGI